MSLQKYIESLSKDKQFSLAINLIKHTLPIWDNFASKTELTYRDSVIGLMHTVNRNLLNETIESVENFLNSDKIDLDEADTKLYKKFIEPIVALQDDDWELPDEVLKTFYAVYILIEALIEKEQTPFGNSAIYVSINHAIDALESSRLLTTEEINKILSSYNP